MRKNLQSLQKVIEIIEKWLEGQSKNLMKVSDFIKNVRCRFLDLKTYSQELNIYLP